MSGGRFRWRHRAHGWLGLALTALGAGQARGADAGPAEPVAAPMAPVAVSGPTGEQALRSTCLDAFKRAQRLRKRSELLSARAELLVCGQPSCPDVVESKCVAWVEEVRAALPSIVVAAVDPLGHDITTAEVAIDGEPMAAALDGIPIELDPGPHAVKVTVDGRSASKRIVVVQGAKDRLVSLTFAPPAPPSSGSATRFGMPTTSWVGFGVAASGLVIGTVTGIAALYEARKLDCPNGTCFQYQDDILTTARVLAHTSTSAFAVAGAGALVGSAGLIWLRPAQAALAAPIQARLGWSGVVVEGSF